MLSFEDTNMVLLAVVLESVLMFESNQFISSIEDGHLTTFDFEPTIGNSVQQLDERNKL